MAAAALASAATYPMGAIQVMGAARARLPPCRTTLVQVASAVPNLVAAGVLGGGGLNVRYLERCGLGRAEAVVAVTLANIAGFVVHVAALAIIGVLVTGTAIAPVREPPRWALLAAVAGLAALAGAVFWSPLGGRRLPAPVREMTSSFLAALRRPRQAALLLAGSAGVTAGYVIALWCSLRAFGAQLPPSRWPALTWLVRRRARSARRRAGSAPSRPRWSARWPGSAYLAGLPWSASWCSVSLPTGCPRYLARWPSASCGGAGCCDGARRRAPDAPGRAEVARGRGRTPGELWRAVQGAEAAAGSALCALDAVVRPGADSGAAVSGGRAAPAASSRNRAGHARRRPLSASQLSAPGRAKYSGVVEGASMDGGS